MSQLQRESNTDIDYSTMPIPADARMPKFALTMAWWAMCSGMFWLVVAATLAIHFGSVNALIGLALSVISYSLINSIIARFAIKTGLSVALFSPILFGKVGAAVATVIFFATAIYYSVFEASVIAVAIHTYTPAINLNTAYLIVVTYSVIFVLGSIQRWLDMFNGVLLPFYAIGLVTAVATAISRYGLNDHWLKLGPAGGAFTFAGVWYSFTYFMGVWIVFMYTFDYARFGKLQDSAYHANIDFGWPFYIVTFLINGAAGIFLAGTVPTPGGLSEISAVLALLKLMGIFGLFFVWVTQTRINTTNFYLAMTNMHAFGEGICGVKLPRFVWATIVGVLVYVIMLTNVFSFILQALAYQGIFVVAWVAIALAHILFVRRKEPQKDFEHQVAEVASLNRRGLTAWFGSAALGIILANLGGLAASFSAPATALAAFLLFVL
jgi:hypothetical protein